MVSNADEMLKTFESVEKDKKWRFLIDQFTIHKQNNNNFDLLPTKYRLRSLNSITVPYDETSQYLEPWNLLTIPTTKKFIYASKAGEMNRINGFTKSWNSIMMFYYIFGTCMLESLTTQYIISYLGLFSEEPYYEQGDGSVILKVSCYDAAVSLRIKLYIRTIWEEMTGKLDPQIAFETFVFLFQNPQKNTSELKNMKGPLLSCSLSRSAKGKMCQWTDSSLSTFKVTDMPKINPDSTTADRLTVEVDEGLSLMRENGMPTVAAKYQKLISEEVNYNSASDFSTLWFLEALTGIMRSNYAITALKSISEARGSGLVYRENNKMAGFYTKLWYEFFSGYVDTLPEDENKFVLDCMSDLTTRSNGLNDFITVDGDLIPNPDVHSADVNVGINESKHISWKFNDKAMTFRKLLENPKNLFDYDKMINSLTYDNPGRLFARYVPARAVRMVYGVPFFRFLAERFTREAVTFLADKRHPNFFESKDLYPISTLAIDTGRYLTEFGQYLRLTGNPQMKKWILLADFSNFDQTQSFVNWRAYAIEALKQVMKDRSSVLQKFAYDVLGGRTPLDYVLGNWETLRDAVFSVYTAKRDPTKLPTGWTLSGENATLVINTMANYAFVLAMIDEMKVTNITLSDGTSKSLSDVITIESFKLQGDDQISVLSPGLLSMNRDDKLIIETAFLAMIHMVAESGGLVISINKTGFRSGHFEFLKKAGIWGYPIPRYMQISLEESENINRSMDSIERMRARLGQYREYEFRGGSTRYALIRRYFEWNMIRQVNIRTHDDIDTKIRLPFALIWTPVSDGGIGMHPHTNVDPNCDIMIGMYPWHPEVRKQINACIYALGKAPAKDNEFIVEQVKEALAGGIAMQSAMDHKAYSDKIKLSKAAYDKLRSKGMKEDKSAYWNRYDQEVREAIEDGEKMRKVNIRWKEVRAESVIDDWNEILLSGQPIHDYLSEKFIVGVSFTYGTEIVNDRLPFCPIAGLDDHLRMWFQQIGTSSEEKIITGDGFSTITRLLSKGNFPRNLKANNIENIASQLLKSNLLTAEDIQDFFVMRGADLEGAAAAAALMEKKIEMLKFLSDVSAFSFVGEGFTDKSQERIEQVVSFVDRALDTATPFTQMIKAVAYQFMRTQKLWDYSEKGIFTVPRHNVHIHFTQETVLEFISKGVIKGVNNIFNDALFESQLRQSVYFMDLESMKRSTQGKFDV